MPVVDRRRWQAMFGGVAPPLPIPVVRSLLHASWAAHLQPVDPGWIDLAASVPVLSTSRIRQLGWQPERSAEQLLPEFLAGRAGHCQSCVGAAHRTDIVRDLPLSGG